MSEQGEVISQKTKDYAMRIEEQMLAVAGEFKSRYWTLGLGAAEIKEKKLYEIRGYERKKAYREYLGIGRWTYFRCRRLAMEIGQPLMKKELVMRARLNRLTLENAEQLLRLDVRRRFSESWVEKAITMKESEFEAQVDAVLLNGEEPEGATVTDPLSIMKIHMLASQRAVIESTFADFRFYVRSQYIHFKADILAGILDAF
jgi:hypothetical protein